MEPMIPRRVQVDKMTPAELAIRAAILEVEKLHPDMRLTGAVILLGQAKDKVSAFVDWQIEMANKPKPPVTPPVVTPTVAPVVAPVAPAKK
jgi:hypothetical protein